MMISMLGLSLPDIYQYAGLRWESWDLGSNYAFMMKWNYFEEKHKQMLADSSAEGVGSASVAIFIKLRVILEKTFLCIQYGYITCAPYFSLYVYQ